MSGPILQDEQIERLAPSLFFSDHNPHANEDDARVREAFWRVYKPLRERGANAYDLSRLATALYHYRPILSRSLQPTRDKHVLEIGCCARSATTTPACLRATPSGC
jgi:hypothetical protein